MRFDYFSNEIEITSCFNFQNSIISALSSCIQYKLSFENAQAIVDTELIVIEYADMIKRYYFPLNSTIEWWFVHPITGFNNIPLYLKGPYGLSAAA